MAEYDFIQDINVGQKPKEAKESTSEGHDHGGIAKAIEHRRPDTLGASAAMHLQRAAGNAAMGALVQRKPDEESPVHSLLGKGGGSSLDSGVREKMESSIGHDFSGVRVHTGPDAAAAAKSVQAQAFTVGNNVVFNEGKYNPSSQDGQRTIAHELTHVVQQSKGDVPGESRAGGLKVSDPGDWAEQQAEATADAVMSSDAGDHAGHEHASAGTVQTLPLQREAVGGEAAELQTLRDSTVQRDEDEGEKEGKEYESVEHGSEEAKDGGGPVAGGPQLGSTEEAKEGGAEAGGGPAAGGPQLGSTEEAKEGGAEAPAEQEEEKSAQALHDDTAVQREEDDDAEE